MACVSAWSRIQEAFPQIAEWLSRGLSEQQVHENIGIDGKTWRKYKKEKPELAELVKKSRIPAILTLRNALFDKATGQSKRVTKKTYRRTDASGNVVEFMEKTEVQDSPNVAAIHLLLKNLDKGNWSNDPVMQEIARAKSGIDAEATAQEAVRIADEQMQEFLDRHMEATERLKKDLPQKPKKKK